MTPTSDGEELRARVASDGDQGELLARMDERQGYVIKALDKAAIERGTLVSAVGDIKVAQAKCEARDKAKWEAQDDINADLRQKKNIGDAIGYALATAAGLFGAKVNL